KMSSARRPASVARCNNVLLQLIAVLTPILAERSQNAQSFQWPPAIMRRSRITAQCRRVPAAADLLRAADSAGDEFWKGSAGWPKTPRALAGGLRRAQTFLRTLGTEVTFSREGRVGTRIISVSTSAELSTVSSVRHNGSRLDQNILVGA